MSKQITLEVHHIEYADEILGGDMNSRNIRYVYRAVEGGVMSDPKIGFTQLPTRVADYTSLGDYLRRNKSNQLISEFAFVT